MGRFTDDQMRLAKSVDLCELAESLGYHVVRIGRCHSLKEMDSMRIYDRRTWYRWSDQKGGSQIDFLQEYAGFDFKDAVRHLLDFSGGGIHIASEIEKKEEEPRIFRLPPRASNNLRIIRYLTDDRGLKKQTVDKFIRDGLIYEEATHHNLVFIGHDAEGTPRYGFMRGTDDSGGKPFKCDVLGSDKSFGFHLDVPGSNTVWVFEGAIDLMSFYDVLGRFDEHMLALGMTNDKPLERYLEDRPEIRRINLCLDNDAPGIDASRSIQKKYQNKGYDVYDLGSPEKYKDFNSWLVDKNKSERKSERMFR